MQMENKKRMPQQAPQAKADKAPAEQDTALVWGKNPVTELLKSEAGVDTLLLADSMEPRMAGYYTAARRRWRDRHGHEIQRRGSCPHPGGAGRQPAAGHP